MTLIQQLLSDWTGILSLVTIAVALGVVVSLVAYVVRRSRE